MPENIPEIEINDQDGPLLKFKSPNDTKTISVGINNDGDLIFTDVNTNNINLFKFRDVQHIYDNTVSSTMKVWTSKLVLPVQTVASTYEVLVSFNFSTNSSSSDFEGDLQLDGTSIWQMTERPRVSSGQDMPATKSFVIEMTEGSHTLELLFRSAQNNKIASISYAQLKLQRI